MKDTLVEQLIYWKNLAELRELSYKQLVAHLKEHHPRVWHGYEQKVLTSMFPAPWWGLFLQGREE
jgi:hypothetical protein